MSLHKRKAAPLPTAPGIKAEIPATGLARYNGSLRAATDDAPGTIGFYGYVGQDWDGNGWTDARMAGVLRAIGDRDIVVNMNSPGGDVFQGLAIYNLLRDHPRKVTVNILGVAASAASSIAMAADEVRIAKAASMMIHNTQSIAIGDRHTMRDAADWMEQFDGLLADIYADRTGLDAKKIGKMLDVETWMLGAQAIDSGFADALVPADEIVDDPDAKKASNGVRLAEEQLLASGLTRAKAQRIIAEIKAGLSDSATPAGLSDSATKPSAFAELLSHFQE
jgi:ATP-dependent Clp protease, protease subunit